jgi:RNA polymerase sigma factor (sigma-70 family)
MDRKFEDYLEDQNILNIMNKVANYYKKAVDLDEIESIKMDTLWKCVNKYEEDRGAKFTSYLYQQLTYAFKNRIKKKRVEFSCDTLEKQDFNMCSKKEVYDIMHGLSDEIKNILNQRFFQNMTMVEIAKANGYSRETARRRLKTAIKKCKKINMIEN